MPLAIAKDDGRLEIGCYAEVEGPQMEFGLLLLRLK